MMRTLFGILVAIVLILNVGVNAHWAVQRFSEPMRYYAAWVLEPRVQQPDATLRMKYIFDRYRYCETFLNRFIIARPDNAIVWRDRIVGGASLLGKHEVLNLLKLPEDLGPGQYIFRTIAYMNCSDGEHNAPAPDMPFEVY